MPRWRDTEDRFIKAHRADGCFLLSEGLKGRGYDRTPEAIKKHARRQLGMTLSMYPVNGYRKCVRCGRWDARPNTQAGRAGFCLACWNRRKSEAIREGRDEKITNAEYQRLKKSRSNARLRSERNNGDEGETERP